MIAQTMAVNAGSRGWDAPHGDVLPHWNDALPGAELGEVEYEIMRHDFERRRAAG